MILTSRDKDSGFDVRLGSINSLVTVGGFNESKLDFRPEAHMIAHDGEVFINVRKPSLTRVDKPVLIDGRAEAICDGLLESFRVTPEGEIEWDTVYPSLPASPEIIKEITDSGNVLYSKQIITPEEARAGARYIRPENEGCIVGYIDGKRDNKYKTGKVFQYTRSIIYDAKGNTAYTDINIYPDGRGKWFLVETLPYEWMKRATCPMIKDPFIGYEVIGGNSGGLFATNWVNWFNYTQATEDGEPLNFNIYATNSYLCKGGGAETTDTAFGYEVNGKDLIGYTGEFTTLAGALTTVPMTVSKGLTTGKWYRAGVIPKVSGANVAFDSGAIYSKQQTGGLYADEMLDPVGAQRTKANSTVYPSMWIEYGTPPTKIPPHIFRRVR